MRIAVAALLLQALMLSAPLPSWAQPWQVVDLDPSLAVDDISNELVAVGRQGRVPFVLDRSGLRLFPEVDTFSPMRITDSGLIGGIRRLPDGGLLLFRVRADGTGYVDNGSRSFTTLLRLTNSGIALVMVTTPSLKGSVLISYYVWNGEQLLSAVTDYQFGSPSEIGEDGTLAGGDLIGPILKRFGQPTERPWAGPGTVHKIGPAGHIVGTAAGDLIARAPDGSTTVISGCQNGSITSVTRSGDMVANCQNALLNRTEAHLVRQGRLLNLNEYFNRGNEYLSAATDLTDRGVIVAAVTTTSQSTGTTRYVLLVPPASAPTGLRATVTGRTVTLSWDATPTALDYVVEAGSAPGLSNFFTGSVDQNVIAGAVPPGRYFVRVRARTLSGLGPPSQELEIDVK